MNNHFTLVPRERIHGTLEGVDFGYNLFCLARSPRALLLWSSGTAYTSGRRTEYGTSALYGLLRNSHFSANPKYDRIIEGGRWSVARLNLVSVTVAIRQLFEEPEITNGVEVGLIACLAAAQSPRRSTVLVEGGGPQLMPSRTLGMSVYDTWRALPDSQRGFVCDPHALTVLRNRPIRKPATCSCYGAVHTCGYAT